MLQAELALSRHLELDFADLLTVVNLTATGLQPARWHHAMNAALWVRPGQAEGASCAPALTLSTCLYLVCRCAQRGSTWW